MKAYELLNNQKKWTKKFLARDSKNRCVAPTDENAIKWCVLGAFVKIYHESEIDRIKQKLKKHLRSSITAWNDNPKTKWLEVYETLKKLNI